MWACQCRMQCQCKCGRVSVICSVNVNVYFSQSHEFVCVMAIKSDLPRIKKVIKFKFSSHKS